MVGRALSPQSFLKRRRQKYQLSVKILGEYQLSVNPIQTLPRGGSGNNDFKNKLRQIQI